MSKMLRRFVIGRLIWQMSKSTVKNDGCAIAHYQKRNESDRPYKSEFASSTILIQDGPFVSELPLVVRKAKNIFEPTEFKKDVAAPVKHNVPTCNSGIHQLIFKEFLKCSSLSEVVSLLSKCNDVTPNIAACAVERILDLKNYRIANSIESISTINDQEDILLNELVDIVSKSQDIYPIINCIKGLSTLEVNFQQKLCDVILERVIDNQLSILQLCDVVSMFGENKKFQKLLENTEKLWVGFIELEKSFNKEDLVRSFEVLHYFTSSRRMVLGVLERKLVSLWWQLKSEDVLKILEALQKSSIDSVKTLTLLGRWLNTNTHTVPEDLLSEIVTKFSQMSFTDQQIERALERYVKAKSVKITSQMLIVTILNHCLLFRIRNNHILNGCAEYFIAHGDDLPPMFIKPILFPLGWLNYVPCNGVRFWQKVESVFGNKFNKINVEDALDIMISCIYLEKHPLNFVEKVFNPHFLERVNSMDNNNILRKKMKIIDTAMSLECKAYEGPLLPKDHFSKCLYQDGRIRRLINHIRQHLEVIAGGPQCLSTQVVLPNLFTTEMYVVDIMLHPKGLRSSILNYKWETDRNINTALLIHLPEHYTSNHHYFIGPQAMRIKHFKIIGLRVVNLEYEILSKLRMHGNELQNYLVNKIKNAKE